jgi:cell division protein FtsL
LNIECVSTGYEINKLKTKKEELFNENKSLQLEASKYKSLERIETLARKEIGLVNPDKFENIFISKTEEQKSWLYKANLYTQRCIGYITKIF